MILDTSANHYEVLEVGPDATQQEIRQAYLRLKLAYSKDSVALYTLVDKDDVEGILRKIEEAYDVLSTEDKRREYDRSHSFINESESPFGGGGPSKSRRTDDRVVSIDRVPPMDKMSREEDLLVAPSTDFSSSPAASSSSFLDSSEPAPQAAAVSEPARERPRATTPTPRSTPAPAAPVPSSADPLLQDEIDRETEFPGHFLRKVREARKISIEEMSDYTKVSKTYLLAIENEDFLKLPAATFVRGFITQVAKKLRLPHDKVAAAYVSRYRRACPDKS